LLATYFEGENFPKVSGLYFGISGAAGTILATTVLSAIEPIISWQGAFLTLSMVGLLVLLMASITLKSTNHQNDILPETTYYQFEQTNSLKSIIFSKEILIILFIFFVSFGVYVSFQGLWVINYLTAQANLPIETVSWLIISLPIGYFIGSYLAGYLSNTFFCSRKLPLQLSLIALLICWAIISLFPGEVSEYLLVIILSLLGLSIGTISPIVFAIITDITPQSKQGIVFGIVNPFSVLGIFIFQILTGGIIDYIRLNTLLSEYSYLIMMLFCFVSLLLVLFTSFLLKETIRIDFERTAGYKTIPIKIFVDNHFNKLMILLNHKINRYEGVSYDQSLIENHFNTYETQERDILWTNNENLV
jgi:MFS family permease